MTHCIVNNLIAQQNRVIFELLLINYSARGSFYYDVPIKLVIIHILFLFI